MALCGNDYMICLEMGLHLNLRRRCFMCYELCTFGMEGTFCQVSRYQIKFMDFLWYTCHKNVCCLVYFRFSRSSWRHNFCVVAWLFRWHSDLLKVNVKLLKVLKVARAPSVHASLNCYNFFVTQAIYIKEYIFLKRLMNLTMSMN